MPDSYRLYWILARCLFLLFFALLGKLAFGQNTSPAAFRFEHLTVDQGLSHSDAMAVAQDRAGFIWVGTNRGLNRYDGHHLQRYMLPINPLNGVSANRIRALHVAPDGRLWVGAERAGLGLYDATTDRLLNFDESQVPARFRSTMRRLAQVTVMALASDRRGRLWVGTSRDGVFVLGFDSTGHLTSLREVLGRSPRAPKLQVSTLACDAEGKVWIGTFNYGLCLVRPETAELVFDPTPMHESIRAMHLDRRGDLWLGTDQQVFWVSSTNRRAVREFAAHPQAQQYPQLQSLLLDSFGRLWVGTIYGLYVWDAGAVTDTAAPLLAKEPTLLLPQDGEPFAINSERVHQLFEDRNQTLWLCASAGGLNKVDLRQKPFGQLRRQLSQSPTLPNNYVNAIYYEGKRNVLWFGTRNGISAYDPVRKTYRNYFEKPPHSTNRGVDVSTIFQTSNGTLWFGTYSSGLITLTRNGAQEKLGSYDELPCGVVLPAIFRCSCLRRARPKSMS